MLIRRPVVAGRFYAADAGVLAHEVRVCLEAGAAAAEGGVAASPWGLMLPHAGHVYCGRVLGATLAGVELPRTLVILCPNHTGRGRALALFAARRLGSPRAKCIIHDTSATVSGDTEHTVGYAGLHLFLA